MIGEKGKKKRRGEKDIWWAPFKVCLFSNQTKKKQGGGGEKKREVKIENPTISSTCKKRRAFLGDGKGVRYRKKRKKKKGGKKRVARL